MQSPRMLVTIVAVLVVVGACGDDDDTPQPVGVVTTTTSSFPGPTTTDAAGEVDTARVIDVVIAGGSVEGGVRRERVALNSRVTLRARSDVVDELHLHTYDLHVELVPGRDADLSFAADIPGVFEVELEDRGKKVLELEVA